MRYAYFLELSNNRVYVGSTNDLKRHVASHNAGDVISTNPNRPAKFLSYLAVQSEQQAGALEKYFKTGSGKAFANKRLW